MFVRKKVFKNKDGTARTYLHLVENKKVEGKVEQKNYYNFGRADDFQVKDKVDQLIDSLLPFSSRYSVLNIEQDLDAKCSLAIGPISVFYRLWKDCGLGNIVEKSFDRNRSFFSGQNAIFNMVLNRLTDPSSKRQMLNFQEEVYGIPKFDLQHYYRSMDYLISEKNHLEKKIFDKFTKKKGGKVDLVFFDTTTIVYYGDDEDINSELLEYGFSKARRGDLKQIVIGVLMSKDGIPIAHEVFPGNKNDVSNFKKIIEKIYNNFSVDRIILVGDRGMISKTNIKYLNECNYEYILGFRMRTLPKSERANILRKANLKEIKKNLYWKEVEYQRQRLFICYNPERAEKDAKHREKIIEKIQEKIKNGSIFSIIDSKDYKRYLNIEGKTPKLSDEKVKYDELYDGVYILTSNTKLSGSQLIEGYKGLWQIESGFRTLKSELEVGPLYHFTDERIKAHVFICFLSLLLRVILTKKLKELFPDASYTECIRDLKKLHVSVIILKGKEIHLRTQVNEGSRKIFKSVKMKPPNKILYDDYSQGLEKVVLRS